MAVHDHWAMVKTSVVLARGRFAFQQRQVFKRKGLYKVAPSPSRLVEAIEGSGREITSAEKYLWPKPEPWVPKREELYPDFRWNFPKDQKEPEGKPVYFVSNQTRFSEGVDQVCVLTKTQKFNGLPPQVSALVGKHEIQEQTNMVQRVIMQSQVWDSTKEKLPKRKDLENLSWVFRREFGIPDTKGASILMNNFIRLSQTMCSQFPKLVSDRIMTFKPSLETSYIYKDDEIMINAVNECLIHGKRSLPVFGNKSLIEKSKSHQLLDMFPIQPTIDFEKVHRKEIIKRGAIRESLGEGCTHPHLVFRIMGQDRPAEYNQAYNLLVTFGLAYTEALNRYGVVSGALPEPVVVQNVNCTYNNFNFLCFQLNTLDISEDSGIKNFVWLDSNNELFVRKKCQPWKEEGRQYKPPTYSDYNPAVFQKFLAMFLYGVL